jgi:tRNA(Ile)-lysidine synthase
MSELIRQVHRSIERYQLLPSGQTVVVGVSGGPDSLCLLHVLLGLAQRLSVTLHVAHLDHSLRPSSAAEAGFVRDVAEMWGLPITLGRADVRSLSLASGLSIEEAARIERYRFLAETALQVGAQRIAVAHHADDQAETVLMHFLRGSGPAGLRGMLPVTSLAVLQLPELAADAGRLCLVRPLLGVERRLIDAYCAKEGIHPLHDESNEDLAIFRNRLRHELLPYLEQYNPGIRRLLGHSAAIMAADFEVLSSAADAAWDEVTAPDYGCATEGCVRFDLLRWRALPLALQRATFRTAVRRLRSSLRDVNWDQIEEAVWLARSGATGQQASLLSDLRLTISYQALVLSSATAQAPLPHPQLTEPVFLESERGELPLTGGWLVRWQLQDPETLTTMDGSTPWTAHFDASVRLQPLSLRHRQPGERFQPLGMQGRHARITEYMINAKVPGSARAQWPVLATGAEPAWLCGLRLDERWRVRADSRQVLEVSLLRSAEVTESAGAPALSYAPIPDCFAGEPGL